jgi:inhibitor of cysteine peptidase
VLKLAAAIVLASCALQVHGAFAADAIVVTEAQANSTVTLAPGQELVVRLASNPSTGYSWSIRADANGVLAVHGEPVFERAASSPGMAGVPGTEVWRILATMAGEQVLVFEYARPWETGQPPAPSGGRRTSAGFPPPMTGPRM